MPEILRHEHIYSNSRRWLHGSLLSFLEKGCARTMAIKPERSSLPDEQFSFGESDGSRNSPFEVEGFWYEVGFIMKKKKEYLFCFYEKKRYKIRGWTRFEENTATVPRQQRQKCLLVFLNANRNNPQPHGITVVALHPEVFRVSYFPQGTEVLL